jgi:hypothetical protein
MMVKSGEEVLARMREGWRFVRRDYAGKRPSRYWMIDEDGGVHSVTGSTAARARRISVLRPASLEEHEGYAQMEFRL